MSVRPAAGDLRTTLGAAGALTTATLPVFLLGALSDQVRAELGIDETAIGAAVTVLFVTVGLVAGAVGRITDRVGAGWALRTGVAVSGTVAAAIGLAASSWWHLAVGFAVVAVALAAIDTGGARAFADGVAPERQGRAFGIKEASVPAASLLAGVALPTVGVTVGWRGAFVGALGVALVVLVLLPRGFASDPLTATAPTQARIRSPEPAEAPEPATATAPVPPPAVALAEDVTASPGGVASWLFAAGVGLGAGAATAAATFLAPAFVARGVSPAAAGTTLAVASLASITMRVAMGRWADRPGVDPAGATSVLLVIGATGAAVLAAPVPPAVATLAAVALLGGGWGWTGLAFLSAVRGRPGGAAVAAGVVLTGLGLGGAGGPPAFGALASRWSYAMAWAVTAGALAVAGVVIAATRPR